MEFAVEFVFEGKRYSGQLSQVPGAGGLSYHFYMQKLYKGMLFYTENYGWVFATQKGYYPEIAEQLIKYLPGHEIKTPKN